MTTLAAQNHKIRQAEANNRRKQFLIRFTTVAVGLIIFLAVVSANVHAEPQCLDQGQPIDCSILVK